MNALKDYLGKGETVARIRVLLAELTDEERLQVAAGVLKPRAALAVAKERRGDCVYKED